MAEHEVTEEAAVDLMVFYGGSFARALGRLYLAADEQNRRRVVRAFQDYFNDYREMVREREKQRNHGES